MLFSLRSCSLAVFTFYLIHQLNVGLEVSGSCFSRKYCGISFVLFFLWLLLLLLRRTCCVCRGVKMLTECSYSLHKHLNPQTKKIYIHAHIKSHTHTHFSFCISRQQVAHSFVLCLTCNAVHTTGFSVRTLLLSFLPTCCS